MNTKKFFLTCYRLSVSVRINYTSNEEMSTDSVTPVLFLPQHIKMLTVKRGCCPVSLMTVCHVIAEKVQVGQVMIIEAGLLLVPPVPYLPS